MKNQKHGISPLREENFPEWYSETIKAGELAETSPVRGCMIIKPWGYALWENMQAFLDKKIKDTGHVNAYFPLLIPVSLLEKEASHIDGFAKECAVVTHHRLEEDPKEKGKLIPTSPLEEPLIIRPTSETIIGHTYSKWVQSYRDLPILINQWANVMRWEMRTRMFLRTSEFLWQEGHTAHETDREAREETLKMLNVYEDFLENILGIYAVKGKKPEHEKFPGAEVTFTLEAMMQDGKALQCATSHDLGQNFSKACQIRYLDRVGQYQWAWTTSWGCTTRLIGALIMSHGDDDGVLLPPKIAPSQIIILPVGALDSAVQEVCQNWFDSWKKKGWKVEWDQRDFRGGHKQWQAIKKGIPVRVECGPKDIQNRQAIVARRDQNQKIAISWDSLEEYFEATLSEMTENLKEKSKHRTLSNQIEVRSEKELRDFFSDEHGNRGWAKGYVNFDSKVLECLKDLKISARCIPFDHLDDKGACLFDSQKEGSWVILGKAY